MLKDWTALIDKIAMLISIALFLLVFITGTKMPLYGYIGAILILGSIVAIIKNKQLNAIIIVLSSLLAIHFMSKIVSAYAKINPELVSSALLLARGVGVLFVAITTVLLIAYNRSSGKEKTGNLIEKIMI